jgi:fluoroquinolone transport system permease protein
MLFLIGFLLPEIVLRTAAQDSNATAYVLLIGFAVVTALGGFIGGAMLGFSLLENKDDNTLQSIAVSPITISGYTTFKSIYTLGLAFIGNMVLLGGMKLFASDVFVINYGGISIGLLDNISWTHIVFFSIASGLIVPTFAMLIASVAKNKIEGFAFMKSSGLVIMLPLLSLLDAFQDGKQYLLGIVPNFWTIKPILNLALSSSHSSNLSFYVYLAIGSVYMILLAFLCYKLFIKRAYQK